jgi:hypothetical protein
VWTPVQARSKEYQAFRKNKHSSSQYSNMNILIRTSKEARMYIEEEDPIKKKICLASDMEVKKLSSASDDELLENTDKQIGSTLIVVQGKNDTRTRTS